MLMLTRDDFGGEPMSPHEYAAWMSALKFPFDALVKREIWQRLQLKTVESMKVFAYELLKIRSLLFMIVIPAVFLIVQRQAANEFRILNSKGRQTLLVVKTSLCVNAA